MICDAHDGCDASDIPGNGQHRICVVGNTCTAALSLRHLTTHLIHSHWGPHWPIYLFSITINCIHLWFDCHYYRLEVFTTLNENLALVQLIKLDPFAIFCWNFHLNNWISWTNRLDLSNTWLHYAHLWNINRLLVSLLSAVTCLTYYQNG